MFLTFNPLYWLFVAPGIILSLWAQAKVRSTYARYARVPNMTGVTGAQAARYLLDGNGLGNVDIRMVRGQLSDNYDPNSRVLNLSENTCRSASVAAIGVAAHEVGHAVQDKAGYAPMKLRSGLVPLANVGSQVGLIFMVVGLFLQFAQLAWIGVILFSMGTLFALVTLPVEFNASRRAIDMLQANGLVDAAEVGETRQVLSAAAWTYVAALLTAILQLLYFVFLVGGMGRQRRS